MFEGTGQMSDVRKPTDMVRHLFEGTCQMWNGVCVDMPDMESGVQEEEE